MVTKTPYAGARSGAAAREETVKILRRLGCSSVGFLDDFENKTLLLAFEHGERKVQVKASAKGWAALFLRDNPWSSRRRCDRKEWEAKALDQGLIAINSILRDWVKGQVTAIQCQMLSFESVFLPYMLTPAGDTLNERLLEAGPGAAVKLLEE